MRAQKINYKQDAAQRSLKLLFKFPQIERAVVLPALAHEIGMLVLAVRADQRAYDIACVKEEAKRIRSKKQRGTLASAYNAVMEDKAQAVDEAAVVLEQQGN